MYGDVDRQLVLRAAEAIAARIARGEAPLDALNTETRPLGDRRVWYSLITAYRQAADARGYASITVFADAPQEQRSDAAQEVVGWARRAAEATSDE